MTGIKFGTDGWRAVISEDFTFRNLGIVSQAVADYLKGKGKVVVGYDSRFLSKEYAQTTARILCANKIKVVLSSGIVSTPLVSFFTKFKKMDLGIMITASHNPYYFNGFKIKNPYGGSADKDITSKVEKLLGKSKVKLISEQAAQEEKLLKTEDLSKDYIKFVRRYINLSAIKKLELKVLVDLMYGTGSSYIEKILKAPKIRFSYLHKEHNPSFAGTRPEPIEENLGELLKQMRSNKFDLGIALDGDGDRINCVLKGGRIVDAQVILPLLALHLARNKKFSGSIVKTVVGSNVIDSVALSLGRIVFETPVGFKYISKLFQTEDILVGGEEAGGIGVKNYIPERDGTMAAILILEMLSYFKISPKALISAFDKKFGRWFYGRTSVAVGKINKASLDRLKIPPKLLGKKVTRVNRLDGIKIITSSGWLMFRASGTEPVVRIYAEAKNKKKALRLIAQGKAMLHAL